MDRKTAFIGVLFLSAIMTIFIFLKAFYGIEVGTGEVELIDEARRVSYDYGYKQGALNVMQNGFFNKQQWEIDSTAFDIFIIKELK